VRLTWIGHATVLIEAGGARLVTDPLLRGRVAHLRRETAPAADLGRPDAVLLSHQHHDHLDVPSLRRLDAPVLGPPGTARTLRRLGRAVEDLRPGDERVVAGIVVRAVPAVHDGRRWPTSRRSTDDAIGFVLDDGERRAYFAGDTELFDGMRELGPIDAALVPIWGWGPRVGAGHMNPSQAAEAVARLAPAVAIPIHWGTYLRLGLKPRHGHLLRDPADAFREQCAAAAPGVRVVLLQPGETHELGATSLR
jgi:L-ascorbate metabolism protein UlaG (beta-lactamase superfamily)